MAQAVVPILTVGATLLTANAAYQQGKAIEQQSAIEAQQIEENARRRIRQSMLDAEEERRQKRIAISNARAAQAASGGVTTSGQSLDQIGKLAGIYEFNAGEILYGGKTDAQALYNQAAARRTEGKFSRWNGTIGAVSTLLNGSTSVYGMLRRNKPPSARPSGSFSPSYNPTTGFQKPPSMALPKP